MAKARGEQGSGRRLVASVLGFLLAFAATGQALRVGLDRAGVGTRRTQVDSVLQLMTGVRLVEQGANGEGRRVVLVGDSHLMVGRGDDLLHERLQQALRARGEHVSVRRVADHGLGLLGHYCLSDTLAAASPHEVVLELNLAHFSPGWQRRQLAPCVVMLEPRRWLEAARLPLHRDGVSLDRLLLYGTTGRVGGLGLLSRVVRWQSRVVLAWEQLTHALQARSPWPEGLAYLDVLVRSDLARARDRSGRATSSWALLLHGAALEGVRAGHPTLRVLDAVLAHYEEAGLRVLVFVNPINVEHLRSLRLHSETGLARTLARAEAVVRARGARWLDLHDLLDDAAFRDHMDHLGPGGGRLVVAERLAEALSRTAPAGE